MKFEYLAPLETREMAIKNNQADIISAVNDEVPSGDKLKIFTLESGEEICIGYTSIVSDDIKNLISNAICNVTNEEKEGVIISTLQENKYPENQTSVNIGVFITLLTTLLISFVIIVLFIRDLKRKLKREKYIDNVTGYGNYNNFEKTFQNVITDEIRQSYCLIDLGLSLKHIESIYGYDEVNSILKNVANVLSDKLKDNEIFCRKTDSSFLLLVDYVSLKILEERIINIYDAIHRKTSKYLIEANFGVYFLNVADRNLDKATYYTLQTRKYSEEKHKIFTVCNKAIISRANEKYDLEKSITQSLKKEEFIGYFQTIVDTTKEDVFAIEVLARWENKNNGFIKPSKFLKILEENNLIYDLDILMFRNACELLNRLQENNQKNVKVFCNFSKISLLKETLANQIRNIINEYDIKPDLLGIVITEDTFYNRKYDIDMVVKKLKESGLKIILDNFGNSVYSLQDLTRLECDYIKISPSMINNIDQEANKKVIAELIKFIRNLGMDAICESVDTEEIKCALKSINCRLLQGDVYSPALPIDEMKFS